MRKAQILKTKLEKIKIKLGEKKINFFSNSKFWCFTKTVFVLFTYLIFLFYFAEHSLLVGRFCQAPTFPYCASRLMFKNDNATSLHGECMCIFT